MPNDLEKTLAFAALGAWTGGCVGALIVWRSRRAADPRMESGSAESAPSGEG